MAQTSVTHAASKGYLIEFLAVTCAEITVGMPSMKCSAPCSQPKH